MTTRIYGVSHSSTSVPADSGVLAPGGTERLLVSDGRGDVPPAWRSDFADPEVERFVAGVGIDAVEDLEAAVLSRLERGQVGLRLYIIGTDAFVRRFERLAREVGLLPGEFVGAPTPDSISLWCAHCKHVTEAPASTVLVCAGCDRSLQVYRHFSRRHAAYMGFQVDAEVPGDAPEARPGMPWD